MQKWKNTKTFAWAALVLGLAAAAAGADDRPARRTGGAEPAARPAEGAPPASGATAADSAPAAAGNPDESEVNLSRQYRLFERTLQQMAEYLRKTEPERARLLIRAIGKSNEDRIVQQMEQVVALLKSDQLGDAIGRQEHLVSNLKSLLELLQSEDRRHQLEEDKKFYESIQKQVEKLSARQKDLRKRTESKRNLQGLSERERQIGDDTQSLGDKIDQQDASRNGKSDKQNNRDRKNSAGKQDKSQGKQSQKEDGNKESADQKKSGDGKNKDSNSPKDSQDAKDAKDPNKKSPDESKQQSDKQNSSKEPNDKDKQPKQGDSEKQRADRRKKNDANDSRRQQSSRPQKGSRSQQQEGNQQSEQSPSEDSDSQSDEQEKQRKTPGREEIEKARQAMQRAEEELKRLNGTKALDHQDEAIRKLAQAKERLEKLLRQLREEEQEIMLASLEARFAKMLVMQIQIHIDTVGLSKTAKGAWSATHFGRARELSVQEDAIAIEASKALTLLKEEGSSVAFPQGVEQAHDDLVAIARRLERNDVGDLTQSMEKDVIESLEELVAALQAEIENRKNPEAQRQRQRRQRQGGQQGENPLVDQLAELKMLRSLQLRINRRTKAIGRRIVGEQATSNDLSDQLQRLGRRQAEIQEATYILASGRNR